MVKLVSTAVAALLAFAAVFVAILVLMQERLLFPRWAVTEHGPTLRANVEHLQLHLSGAETLVGVRLPARLPGGDGRAAVLGFGGHAWHAHGLAAHLCRLFPTRDIVVFHYRGYGPSTGRPATAAFNADALAIFDDLRLRRPWQPVIGVGLSIGAGPAAHMAARRDVKGLILVTPFDSLQAVARHHLPYLPVRRFLRHEIDVVGDLLAYEGPVATIAAKRDALVPPERTQAVRRAIRRHVFDTVIEGAGHYEMYARRDYAEAMRLALYAIETDEQEIELLQAKAPADDLPECGAEL